MSYTDGTSKNGEQIQENEKSTDNVPVTQEKTNEQPLFRDEEQVESETHVPTEEAPITSGSQPTLPAALRFQKKTPHQKEAPQLNIKHILPRQSTSKSVSQTCTVNVGFQSGAVTSIELMEKCSFTAEEVSRAIENCMFIIRESSKICGRKNTENEEFDMVYRALPSFIFDRCQSGEKILQMPNSDLIMKPEWINLHALESTISMKAQDTETLALILRPFAELPKWAYVDLGNVVEKVCEFMRAIDAPSIQTWSISSPRMQQNQKSNLNNNVSIAYQFFFFLDLKLFLQQIVKIIESRQGGTHWQDWNSQR
ncbi:hypothetical protein BY996DRAFT_6420693 [Phakopsora pachyrhizi]|nr:hypothetical protein BY996DRAFT_6420693 [Phakopsora pachyrhizi]